MAATCDGLRVRLVRALQFHRCEDPRGLFTMQVGTVGEIVDTEETREYARAWKGRGAGQVRYVDRGALEVVRDAS